jgi:hypothetical protein
MAGTKLRRIFTQYPSLQLCRIHRKKYTCAPITVWSAKKSALAYSTLPIKLEGNVSHPIFTGPAKSCTKNLMLFVAAAVALDTVPWPPPTSSANI